VVEQPADPTGPIVTGLAVKQAEQTRLAGEATRQAEALEVARKAALAESEKWRSQEAAVRSQIEELNIKTERLEQEADALARQRDVLAHERDAAKAALVKARAKNGGYAVMPHKSQNGTWQRPVILECREGKAFLQPQGLAFSMIDMSPFLDARSPLVVGVASELIRAQRAGAPDGSNVIPYIYFVVRPDGIRPFYEARAALERLGIAFGYELVDQDWEIDFPDFDNLIAWDGPGATTPKTLASNESDPNKYVWPAQRQGAAGLGGDAASGSGSGESPFLWPAGPRGGGLARGDGIAPDAISGSRSRTGAGPSSVPGSGDGGSLFPEGPRGSGIARRDGDRQGVGEGARPPSRGGRGQGTPGGRSGQGQEEGLVPLDPSSLPGFNPSDTSAGAPPPLGGPSSREMPRGEAGAGAGPAVGYGTPRGRGGIVRPSAGDGRDQLGGDDSGGGLQNTMSTPPDGRVPIDPDQIARIAEEEEMGNRERPRALPRNSFRSGTSDSDGAPPPPFARLPGNVNDPNNASASGGSTTDRSASSTASTPPPPGGLDFMPGSVTSGSSTPMLITSPPSGISLPTTPNTGANSGSSSPARDLDLVPPKPADPIRREQKVEVALDLTIGCRPDGVIIHPGGYRISLATLKKDGVLKTDLQTIVRNHEIADPMVIPRPRIEFLIEPGGGQTYQLARKQTVLAALGWAVTFRIADSTAPRVFTKERF
jgi:hypothetical protein